MSFFFGHTLIVTVIVNQKCVFVCLCAPQDGFAFGIVKRYPDDQSSSAHDLVIKSQNRLNESNFIVYKYIVRDYRFKAECAVSLD